MKITKTTSRSDLERRVVGIVVIACALTVLAALAAVFA
jgi:hypothetical protein